MWNLSPGELGQLRGAGGERFAHFMDRLIRAETARAGVPQSEIQTQLRVNIRDGGADTEVKQALPGSPTGWFGVPTCWQFKAVDGKDIGDRPMKTKRNELQEEIHKPYVEKLISRGYGYRLCILGDLPPPKVSEWESQLKTEAQSINPSAPDPRVVHGGHLPEWGERFPAVIARLRHWTKGILHWEAWSRNCRSLTRHYVPNPNWKAVREQILEHVDFKSPCVGGDPCMTIGGAAGVGKTRLVFESLNEWPASPGLVVYAEDEQEAKSIAVALANLCELTAVLVADECTPDTRLRLNETLRGHVDRIRVVCLDNTGKRPASRTSEFWLTASELENTDAILERNFRDVPFDRRHLYAEISEGFVRLAADMCNHNEQIAPGDLSALRLTVEPYVRSRIPDEQIPLISLLALFDKVGFRDDVRGDLESLCELANCRPQDFRAAVRAVRESPGFVVQAGRFWYVTPEIVAHVLFAEGWEQWVKLNLTEFMQKLPDHLQRHLIDRAKRHGEQGVRDQIAAFFRQWFDQLTATDLVDPQVASLADAIVEAKPEEFLPRLRVVLDQAAPAELLQIQGYASGAKWGPRRTLVWLLERLVSFSEFFTDCEACLFRLATHETEPQIGNNATRIWESLFSVHRSGTAAPFVDRVEALRIRSFSSDSKAVELAFGGIKRALEWAPMKGIGPPVVAGRLRPEDWDPRPSEELACYRAILGLCNEHFNGAGTGHCRLAFDVLADRASFILSHGLCDELREILDPQRLSEDEIRRLLNKVDKFLGVEEQTGRAKANERASAYIRKVRDWIETFRPSDFDGRLRSLFSRDPWDRRFTEDPQTQGDETDELALQIIREPTRLHAHLDWLATAEARSAERLGVALGSGDESFACGEMIFEHAIARGAAPLLRGYVRGLASSSRSPTKELLHLADRLEASRPDVAVDILACAGDAFDGLNRVVRLVEEEHVSPRSLAVFAMGVGRRNLKADELRRILPYFVAAARSDDAESARAGLRFLSTVLQSEKQRSEQSCLTDETLREAAWELAQASLPFAEHQVAYEWTGIVEHLTPFDPRRAASLLGLALLADVAVPGQERADGLIEMAPKHPEAVMESFANALLDPENGWRLQVRVHREVVRQIPTSLVMQCLDKHGIEAARAIARHLPPPYVDDDGRPVVPEVLEAILRKYDDDQLFRNFLAGTHSGEVWRGNAAERLRREAEDAQVFLRHANPRIREWAKREIADRLGWAEWEDREHAERFLPS